MKHKQKNRIEGKREKEEDSFFSNRVGRMNERGGLRQQVLREILKLEVSENQNL
ncbi:Protein CBG25480 [Caenorhabditis briggsae]|uniref:Protein CBG25480 n=1 Tax=Caenorhabditis briggsae TaxID=6238 RepID=B6IIV5_CAEBR|nr:Protein CBG25480 [Caenorhabditis briggsae]CAR99835.1 Protein CBG25480 [Caenorhabditis briggsae]